MLPIRTQPLDYLDNGSENFLGSKMMKRSVECRGVLDSKMMKEVYRVQRGFREAHTCMIIASMKRWSTFVSSATALMPFQMFWISSSEFCCVPAGQPIFMFSLFANVPA